MILDIGCGDGYQMRYFANIPTQIVGIDISTLKLKRAKKGVWNADFIRASSLKLPFKPEMFDKVLCLELLEHLKHPSKTINEIDLVLKKNGILIMSVPYKKQIILTQCIHCGEPTPHWGHLNSFDEQKILNILPQNYNLLRYERICTPASSYPPFAFLSTKLWKLVDTFSRMMPHMSPYWIISKIQKQ